METLIQGDQMKTLSQRLKYFRQQKNLTVTQIARKLEVAVSTYRDWENGRAILGEPYVKLADIFGISLHRLMTGQEGDMKVVFDEIDLVKNSLYRLERELQARI